MKKCIAVIAALLILSACAALASDIIPKQEGTPCNQLPDTDVYTEETYWAIEPTSTELIGITSPCEDVPVLSGLTTPFTRIRGVLDDGIIRVKGRAVIAETDEGVTGLAVCTCAIVQIRAEFIDVVREIVTRRTGGELCARTVIASTLWRKCDTVSHIFWLEQPIVAIGSVTVSGSTLIIWCGDFDGDGNNELGFKAGVGGGCPSPEPTPEPMPTIPPVYLMKPISPCQTPYYVILQETLGNQ